MDEEEEIIYTKKTSSKWLNIQIANFFFSLEYYHLCPTPQNDTRPLTTKTKFKKLPSGISQPTIVSLTN